MPDLPGFALKDGRVYAVPVGRLWRRFNLYPSGFSRDRFTIYCVVAPLYTPEGAGAVLPGLGDRLPIMAGHGDACYGKSHWRTKSGPSGGRSVTEPKRPCRASRGYGSDADGAPA
jgi:hypothetical protein